MTVATNVSFPMTIAPKVSFPVIVATEVNLPVTIATEVIFPVTVATKVSLPVTIATRVRFYGIVILNHWSAPKYLGIKQVSDQWVIVTAELICYGFSDTASTS